MGVERTPNKSHHTKLTLEKKILLPLLPGFELATFRPQVWRSYQQAVLANNNDNSNNNNKEVFYSLQPEWSDSSSQKMGLRPVRWAPISQGEVFFFSPLVR